MREPSSKKARNTKVQSKKGLPFIQVKERVIKKMGQALPFQMIVNPTPSPKNSKSLIKKHRFQPLDGRNGSKRLKSLDIDKNKIKKLVGNLTSMGIFN